jgi:hypothetical protein
MIVVGICALAASAEADAPHFARDTGLALYEARLRLSQPAPIVALRTADRDAALRVLASLRARGHDAVACDEDAIPRPYEARDIRIGEALACSGRTLAYDGILTLIRAVRASHAETTERVTERKLRPGMALVTGGLVMSKKVTREEKHVAHDKEDLLYVFSREGGAPWLVSERGTSYASLDDVAKLQRENFLRVTTTLRSRAPSAAYDERLLALRGIDDPREIDVRAQLLAISIARRATP